MTPTDPIDWTSFNLNMDIGGPVVGDYSDPGMLHWSGQATYTVAVADGTDWRPDQDQALSVARIEDGEDLYSEWTVLTMGGLIVDPRSVEARIPRLLNEISEDYDHFGVLFDGTDFHPDLMDHIDGVFGSRAVLIDRVHMAPAWRGHGGVGRLLISRILRLFAADAKVVATNPFPIVLFTERDGHARLTAHPRFDEELAKVQRTWASLGFQLYKDPIWVMDPARSGHADAVAELERRLAAAPAHSR
ncbi:hypothetical protein ACFXHA_43150 [Nocardia sp. NPDC059240]|uniref:hypothetical protein n=1 Tax=Nocardia sp. NPDC059240 TaxID=3346786 RepID=UPI0036AD000B